jgi:hypothetical protein
MLVPFVGNAANGPSHGEAELLALHQADRRAHFAHDVNALLAHTAARVVDVRKGKITVLSRDDLGNRFAEYFRRADFSAWDDVQPPIVHVSSDGRTGWMIVRVRISYTDTEPAGKKTMHDETMAWMSAYEKQNGVWMMTAVTSASDKD